MSHPIRKTTLATNVRARGRRSGAAVLDMALVLPVLLYLAFGTVEYGYYFYVKHNVQSAAREGARAAIVPSATAGDVTTAVQNVMSAAGLQSTGYTVTITDTSNNAINVTTATAGTAIKVNVQLTWGSVGVHPLPTALGGINTAKLVRGNTVMRKEG
ncbi:MAG TPA: TadE/TadG family type IV pilus assembly protein [Tepidisphaeraceae bacterium]|nr:TadE/TadG family type IV pilus assembly protein [Tepidisphaeraceae bacterium]